MDLGVISMLLWSQFYASHGRDSPTLGRDSELKRRSSQAHRFSDPDRRPGIEQSCEILRVLVQSNYSGLLWTKKK